MLTIVGSTGLVGKPLAKAVLKAGERVRLLTRDPAKAKGIFDEKNAEIVQVNFDDPKSLAAAFKGTDRAFIATGTSDRQVRDEKALIDAAVSSGVASFVALSVNGAGRGIPYNVLEWHSEIDAHLAQKGVTYTLIRPCTFIDTILYVAAGFIPHNAWGGTAGNGKSSFIDSRDVAAVGATILLEGDKVHGNKVYDLTGPTAVSMADLAQYISQGKGQKVGYQNFSAEQQRGILQSAGLPQVIVDVVLRLDDMTRDNLFAEPLDTVFELTKKRATSPQAWVKEHIGNFALPKAPANA